MTIACGFGQQLQQQTFGPFAVDAPYGQFQFTTVTLWGYSDIRKATIPALSATLNNRTGTAWRSVEFLVTVKCPGVQEQSYPIFLYDLAEGETRQIMYRASLGPLPLTPCDAERVQIAFTKGDSKRAENERRAAEDREAGIRIAKREAEEKAHTKVRAEYLSKNFVSIEAFRIALARVIAAAEENFRPVIGKSTRGSVDGSLPEFGERQYYSKVVVPKLNCRVLAADDSGAESTAQAKGERSVRYFYACILDSGYLTRSLKRAYENLVDTVKFATGLPSWASGDSSLGFVPELKTEARPHSGVFEGDRWTIFSKDAANGFGGRGTFIKVSLEGSPGLNGNWCVKLIVSNHFPE